MSKCDQVCIDWTYVNICIGMTLCACRTAVKDFKNIVSVVGGIDEQQRAELAPDLLVSSALLILSSLCGCLENCYLMYV